MSSVLDSINESRERVVNEAAEAVAAAIREERVDEGVLLGLIGGLTGLTAGASLMKGVCKVLGVEHGMLYDLLTSKAVCAAVGFVMAKHFGK